MASVLGLRDNDEGFGFLIANETYRLVNLDAMLKFRQAMENDSKKLTGALRKNIVSTAETPAKKSVFHWRIATILIMAISFGGAAWFVDSNYRASLTRLESVVSTDAKMRMAAAFLESEMGMKVQALREKGELDQLLDFAGTKVGKFALNAYEEGELLGLLKFAASPAGELARKMDQKELLKILERAKEGEDTK